MENDILLSIAIPTYNRAECLKSLLTNILAQAKNLPERIEICISNNGSPDNTREVVRKFIEEHPGIIKYHENEKNLGIDKNVLLVMEMATGQFMWTFGDDDIIVEDGLRKIIELIKKHADKKTGLILVREEQFFIDQKTQERVVCLNTVDKQKPDVFVIPRDQIVGLFFPDIAWISALIFNNTIVKKMFAEDRADLERGIGTLHPHLPLIVFMFLKYTDLVALAFNKEAIVQQELASYKSFIEDKFVVHYKVQKKLNQLLLSSPYIDKHSTLLIRSKNKGLRRAFIVDMLIMKAFNNFKYSSYWSCLTLFFSQANFFDAIVFSLVFSILFLIPPAVLIGTYKLLLMARYGKQWKPKWDLAYDMVTITNGGTRRRAESDNASSQKNKKIIFFVPALDMGGVQRIVSELSLHLPDTIEKVIVLFAKQDSYPFEFNAKILSLDLPLNNTFIKRMYYFLVAILRFRKLVKKEKPDYVMSFNPSANIINIFSGANNILRIDNYSSEAEPTMYKPLAKIFFRTASAFICASKVVAKNLTENYGVAEKKIKVIYYSLDVKRILDLSKEVLEPKCQEIFNHPVIINIGRFTGQKGQWHLIRAFAKLKETIEDAQLVILGGQGDLEKELKKMVLDLGLQKDIHFIGWQKNSFKFLAKAKVFALSSLWEGFPYATLEALACGLPIVSTDCKSGPREMLAPKTPITKEAQGIEYAQFGILTQALSGKKYQLHDPLEASEEMFKNALIEVLTNKELADNLSEKSKERAQDFDVSTSMKAWDFITK